MSRVALPLLVISFAAAACGGGDPQAAAGGAPPAMPPMEVKTVTLAEKPVPQSSEFVATVRSLRSTTIQPQVEGFVRQILVQAGDRVRAGQPLVQIDPDRQQAAARVTESQRAAREADLALAKQQLERAAEAYEAGAVARAAVDEAEAAHKSAEAQLNALQSQIREDQVQLQYYRVTAPSAGIVGDIPSGRATGSRRRRSSRRSIRAKLSRPTSTCRSSRPRTSGPDSPSICSTRTAR